MIWNHLQSYTHISESVENVNKIDFMLKLY